MKGTIFVLFAFFFNLSLAANITRVYYIAAEEVEWDYAPSGKDMIRGINIDQSEPGRVFCLSGDDRIGKVYIKAVYRQYTDDTFTQQVPHPASLGFLGPIIRAEVSDRIKIVFKNKASLPFSIHAHGVRYDKSSEGAVYNDDNLGEKGGLILPGKTYTYNWDVPERAGPGPADADSLLWTYHSHVSERPDVNTGLVGPIIIYKSGLLGSNGLPIHVDREYVIYYSVIDENFNRFLTRNIEKYCSKPELVDKDDDDFVESNMMHSINGFVLANLPGIYMCSGERVRWYLFALGDEVDLHTAHWHGQTLLMDGHRVDVLEMLPATMRTLDMYPDNTGKWLSHCHVSEHNWAGMSMYFEVDNCK